MSTPRLPAPRSSGAPMIAAFMRVVYRTAGTRAASHSAAGRYGRGAAAFIVSAHSGSVIARRPSGRGSGVRRPSSTMPR